MNNKDQTRKEYPPDPNFAGAFAGGPPLLTAEEAKRLMEDPESVEQEIRARWRRILQERAAAAANNPSAG